MKLARKRRLFVDDERGIRETLSLILLRYGFTVSLAATFEQALAQIKLKKTAGVAVRGALWHLNGANSGR
jgi:DNA-binding NtrC family response regulator